MRKILDHPTSKNVFSGSLKILRSNELDLPETSHLEQKIIIAMLNRPLNPQEYKEHSYPHCEYYFLCLMQAIKMAYPQFSCSMCPQKKNY